MKIIRQDKEEYGVFKALLDGEKIGELSYSREEEGVITLDHTYVSPSYRGKGVAEELFYQAVEFARKENLRIIPVCSFAKAMFTKDKSIGDIRR